MTTRKPRAPAHMLRLYALQYRPARGARLEMLSHFTALTPTGALVQAAHALARWKLNAVELIATEQGV